MTTQQEPTPDGREGGSLEHQLEELGKQLGFYVEASQQTSNSDEPPTLRIATISHRADGRAWQQLCRHLELLEVPGRRIEWSWLQLPSPTSERFMECIREQ